MNGSLKHISGNFLPSSKLYSKFLLISMLMAFFIFGTGSIEVPVGSAEEKVSSQVQEWFDKGDVAYNKKDYKNALLWYRKAAEQGNAEAQMWLGFMYGIGSYGVERDDKQALLWYRKQPSRDISLQNII